MIDRSDIKIHDDSHTANDETMHSFYKSIEEDDEDLSMDSMPKLMAKNNIMEQIEREISLIMKESHFLNEKS